MLSVIAMPFRAAGTAMPLAVGVAETQKSPVVSPVELVAAMNNDVEPVMPRVIVAVGAASPSVPTHHPTMYSTRTSPVTVNHVVLEAAPPSVAAPVNVTVLVARYGGRAPRMIGD